MKKLGKKIVIYLMTLLVMLMSIPMSLFAEEQADDIAVMQQKIESSTEEVYGAEEVPLNDNSVEEQLVEPVKETVNDAIASSDEQSEDIVSVIADINDEQPEEADQEAGDILQEEKEDMNCFSVEDAADDTSDNLTLASADTVSVTFYANNNKAFFVDSKTGKHVSSQTFSYENGDYVDEYEHKPQIANSNLGFAGWATNKNAKEPQEEITITKDTKLYAVWKEYITVTIRTQDGYMVDYDNNSQEIHAPEIVSRVLKGTTINKLYVYARNDDHHKVDFGQRSYTPDGAVLNENTVVNNGDVLYVKWIDYVAVTFDPQGGSVNENGPLGGYVYYLERGDNGKITAYYPKGKTYFFSYQAYKDNKAFAGWSVDGTEKGIEYYTTLDQDLVLKAVYTDGYKVSLASANLEQGVPAGYVNGQNINYRDNPTFIWPKDMPLSTLAIYGIGVDTDSSEDGKFYTFKGFSTTKDAKDIVSGNFTPDKDMTLYAIFEEGVSISLNPGEGYYKRENRFYPTRTLYMNGQKQISVKTGAKIGNVEIPAAPEGKVFVGWQDSRSEKVYADISGLKPSENMYFIAVFKKPIRDFKVNGVKKAFVYTGSSIKPKITVNKNAFTLVQDKDYSVTFSNNKNVGAAKITITGIGNYTGKITKTFKITKASNTFVKVTTSKFVKFSKLKKKKQTFKISATDKGKAKKTFKLKAVPKKAKKYISVSKAGKVTVSKGLKKGSYKIKVKITAAATRNYKKVTAIKTINIVVK